jgi:hypothetical protein
MQTPTRQTQKKMSERGREVKIGFYYTNNDPSDWLKKNENGLQMRKHLGQRTFLDTPFLSQKCCFRSPGAGSPSRWLPDISPRRPQMVKTPRRTLFPRQIVSSSPRQQHGMKIQDESAGATTGSAERSYSAHLFAKLLSRCNLNADCEQDAGLKARLPPARQADLHSPSTARTGMRNWSSEKSVRSVRFAPEEQVMILRHEPDDERFGELPSRSNPNAAYKQDACPANAAAVSETPTKEQLAKQRLAKLRSDRSSESGVRSGRFSPEEQAVMISRLERYA